MANSRETSCNAAVTQFKTHFSHPPKIVGIAPGRVNLIGEHVDHQGYSVLPAALNHTIVVAVGSRPDAANFFSLRHGNPAKFPNVDFKTISDVKVGPTPKWSDYIVASFFGIVEYVHTKSIAECGSTVPHHECLPQALVETANGRLPAGGLELFVQGNVPVAAGVSSSSALVVAASVTLSKFMRVELSRHELADICANSERHSGTAGGGMDQATICLSQQGMARLIHFNPLSTEPIPLPTDAVLVVCNSGRDAPKAVDAATCYNKRVFELRLACYMILRGAFPQEEIPAEQIPQLSLKYVQEKLRVEKLAAIEIAKKYISHNAMGKAEAEAILGKEGLRYLLIRVGAAVWERNVYFDPLRRVIHVFDEAQRVFDFVRVCRDQDMEDEDKLTKLGKFLDASDESLSLFFDCGCPELAELTALARASGAYGSRITGAGWGGCTVSLVHKNNVQQFIEKMKSYFTRANRLVPITVPENLDDALFAVDPDDGVSTFQYQHEQEELVPYHIFLY